MGRKAQPGGGIEVRATTVRIIFRYNGRQYKEPLCVDGKPVPPTAANIKAAQRIAGEIRQKLALDLFAMADYFPHTMQVGVSQAATVGDFLDTWYRQLTGKTSTLTTYRRMKDNFWKPKIGSILLAKLKHTDITHALKEGGWESGKTRNNYKSMLSAALDVAVADGAIERNPCATIKQAKWQKAQPDPFDAAEVELILDDLRCHYDERVWNFAEFWFFTGLRTSEIIALDWPRIDLRKREMLIDRGFVVDKLEESTKTDRSRLVKLNSRAMAALTRQQAWTKLAGAEVFQDPGTGLSWAYEQNFRKRYWMPCLKRLGIRYRRPYAMRSTCATMGLMAGANPAWMAQQLGHAQEVFFRDYAKWINGRQDDAEMEKIEAALQRFDPSVIPAEGKTTVSAS